MSNDQAIEDQIQERGLTAPRITVAHIQALKNRVFYQFEQPMGTTSTFCHAYLDGRFYLTSGHSACVSVDNFDAAMGEDIARRNATNQAAEKLWGLEGYRLFMQLNEEPPIS